MKTIVAMSLAFAALVTCADEVVTNTPTYTPPPMEELMQKFYEEKNATVQGRVFLHGKVAEERKVERDGTNYTQVVYADGYVYERVMRKYRPKYDMQDAAAKKRRERMRRSRGLSLEKASDRLIRSSQCSSVQRGSPTWSITVAFSPASVYTGS